MKFYLNAVLNYIKKKWLTLLSLLVITLIFFINKSIDQLSFKLFTFLLLTVLFQIFFFRKSSYTLYLIRSLVIILMLFELVCGKLLSLKIEPTIKLVADTHIITDSILGYRLMPNIDSAKSEKFINEKPIYSVYYSTDVYGRRIPENLKPSLTRRDKHLILLGCSFTFGEGLKYESSIPAILNREDSTLNTYNYGLSGFGPHQNLLLFGQGLNLINRKSIKEESGFLLYTFIIAHLDRVYGSSDYLKFGALTPDVFIEDGKLITKRRSKIQLLLSEVIWMSNTLKYFNVKLNYPQNEEFYKRFAAIINMTSKDYHKVFPNSKFLIGIYPGQNKDLKWLKYLEKEIIVIEVPAPIDYASKKYKYVLHENHDRHPNQVLNEYYANFVLNILNKN